MLLNQMGRDRALAGMQAFIKTYHGNPDHPVLQDFLASMRPFAADPAAFDAFTHQWFFEVVVPEYRLHEPKKTAHGQGWEVTVRLENVGTGVMPVEVAATRGERFAKDGSPQPDYREARDDGHSGQGRVERRRHHLPVRARADRRRSRRQGPSASAEERGGQVLTQSDRRRSPCMRSHGEGRRLPGNPASHGLAHRQSCAAAQANLVVPGTGTGGMASGPNSYSGGSGLPWS